MNKDNEVIVSVSNHTYLLLWIPTVIVVSLFSWLAFNKQFSDALLIALLIFILVILLTILLIRLKLIINFNAIEYYGFLKKTILPISNISKIKIIMTGREYSKIGIPKGPGIQLIIETTLETNIKPLCLNIKIFNKSQLRNFIETACKLKIDVYIDEVISVMLFN